MIWRQYSPTPGPRPPPPSPPPVLSNPAVIPSVTTAAFSVDSTGAGTIYYIVSTSTAQPTVDQMLSGHDANDFPAAASGLVPVTVAGTQTFTASGLVGTLYNIRHIFWNLGQEVIHQILSTSSHFRPSSFHCRPAHWVFGIWIRSRLIRPRCLRLLHWVCATLFPTPHRAFRQLIIWCLAPEEN